jgi:hypothetical protein
MRGTGEGRQWIRPLRGTGSASDRALHRLVGRYAVGFRLWIAVAVLVAAPLASTASVSGAWLAAVLVTLSAWSVFFAVRVGRRGVTGPLVLADAAVIVALIMVHHLVVPAALISAGTTWMLPLASTAIYISQLCVPPPATKTVPATAADRITDCAAEALRIVARHAGTGTAELRVRGGNGQVVVEIIDQGRGFDARSVPRSRAEETAGTPHWPGNGTVVAARSPG